MLLCLDYRNLERASEHFGETGVYIGYDMMIYIQGWWLFLLWATDQLLVASLPLFLLRDLQLSNQQLCFFAIGIDSKL